MEAAPARPEPIEKKRPFQQPLGVALQRRQQPDAHSPAKQPRCKMQQLVLMPCAEANVAQRRIPAREQFQVRDIAIAEQPCAELGIALRMETLPLEDCSCRAVP